MTSRRRPSGSKSAGRTATDYIIGQPDETAHRLLKKSKQDRSFGTSPQSFHTFSRVSVDRMQKIYKDLLPQFVVNA
jgi:hypothetical protein